MKIYVNICNISLNSSNEKLFQTKVLDKIRTHILCSKNLLSLMR